MAATGERIAFLGIGTMGHGMAESALRAGLSGDCLGSPP